MKPIIRNASPTVPKIELTNLPARSPPSLLRLSKALIAISIPTRIRTMANHTMESRNTRGIKPRVLSAVIAAPRDGFSPSWICLIMVLVRTKENISSKATTKIMINAGMRSTTKNKRTNSTPRTIRKTGSNGTINTG